MIALFGRDEYSVLGTAAVLDAEKIPYRRVETLEASDGDLPIVAGADLSPEEVEMLSGRRGVVLNGGRWFAQHVFRAAEATITSRGCSVALDAAVWPRPTTALARSFGKAVLRIPLAPVCEVTRVSSGSTLAWLSGSAQPAIVERDHLVWSAIDLGAAFANLLTESYLPVHKQHAATSRLHRWTRRTAEAAYYAAPDPVRGWVQRRSYGQLRGRLDTDAEWASESPIDVSGWLLIELVKSLIRLAAGGLVRLERWPAPYRAAATLTHDIEPRRYAYTAGLDRLLSHIATLGHPGTLGLVADACDRYLPSALPRLRDHSVICHGLEHRGEQLHGREQVSASIQLARARLEQYLRRRVSGYRSPRLDRSADLAAALDCSGFRFDSSYPDVDRENVRHFGGGVRLNLPFRVPLRDRAGVLRPSRCLELPLTAPDCIQPLLAGDSVAQLRATVEAKAAFVRATGGLYVALVHGGVFGEADSIVREEHLDFVYRQLRQRTVWLAGTEQIVDWWCAREALQVTVGDDSVDVINGGPQAIDAVRVVIERENTETVYTLPPLRPGARVTLGLPEGAAGRPAEVDVPHPSMVPVSTLLH